jgi:F0F1-type ATP synthase epsilon subunit
MTDVAEVPQNLRVVIKSKNDILFQGTVSTITSKNERGVFDILLLHTNFITLISEYIILDKDLPTQKRFNFEKGVLYVLANKVDIYVGI